MMDKGRGNAQRTRRADSLDHQPVVVRVARGHADRIGHNVLDSVFGHKAPYLSTGCGEGRGPALVEYQVGVYLDTHPVTDGKKPLGVSFLVILPIEVEARYP